MELILHFGMHKTGSSSIQESFFHCKQLQDVEYVELFGLSNGSLAINKGFVSNYFSRKIFANQKISPEDIAQQRKQARKAIAQRLEQVTAKRAIISAEGMAFFEPDDFAEFIDFLRPYASSIKAVGYLRTPKSYMESAFQERLKRLPQSFDDLHIKIKYKRLISGFDNVLGKENVFVWKFDPQLFPNKCVVQDFCQKLDINLPSECIVRVNEGMSKEAVQMLYTFWHFYPTIPFPFFLRAKLLIKSIIERQPVRWTNLGLIRSQQFAKYLSRYKGEKFRVHSEAYNKIVAFERADELSWTEERCGFSLQEDIMQDDAYGFKTGKDFLYMDEKTVHWLLAELGKNTDDAATICQQPEVVGELLKELLETKVA